MSTTDNRTNAQMHRELRTRGIQVIDNATRDELQKSILNAPFDNRYVKYFIGG